MKSLFVFVAVLVVFHFANAQCAANAGPDLFICGDDTTKFILGGSPTANFGTAPYTYTWSMNPVDYGFFWVHASDVLNDTTLANPELIGVFTNDTMHFNLEITDSLGCIATDTLTVYSSTFAIGLGSILLKMNKGDSLYLGAGHNVWGGLGASTYLWRPNHGLRDSTNASPGWVKPERSVYYYVTVTDAIGCTARGYYYQIDVNTISLQEPLARKIKVYPNPVREKLQVKIPEDLELNTLRLLDLAGRLVRELNPSGESHNLSDLPRGIYILEISTNEGVVRKCLTRE
jgi:hypothetical protein